MKQNFDNKQMFSNETLTINEQKLNSAVTKEYFKDKQMISNDVLKNKAQKLSSMLLFNHGGGRAKSSLIKTAENERKKWLQNREILPMIKVSCPPKKKKKSKCKR